MAQCPCLDGHWVDSRLSSKALTVTPMAPGTDSFCFLNYTAFWKNMFMAPFIATLCLSSENLPEHGIPGLGYGVGMSGGSGRFHFFCHTV